MMEHVYESEPYQRLVVAVRAHDWGTMSTILEEQVAASTGREKAFWMSARLSHWLRRSLTPLDCQRYWPEVEAIFLIAPEDPFVQKAALSQASVIALRTQQLGTIPRWVRLARKGWQLLRAEGDTYWSLRAIACELRSHWLPAYRAYSRALAHCLSRTGAKQKALEGHLVFVYAGRAIAGLACGRTDHVEADITASITYLNQFPRSYMHPMPTALAEAEWALYQRRFRDAHAALQQGLARNAETAYARHEPEMAARIELFAARLARAEGNMVSFLHFCERALGIAREHGLVLTARSVQAVRAGAER